MAWTTTTRTDMVPDYPVIGSTVSFVIAEPCPDDITRYFAYDERSITFWSPCIVQSTLMI